MDHLNDRHASALTVGSMHGKWTVDRDNWLFRRTNPKDRPLVARTDHAFIERDRTYVRSLGLAERLDRGLLL